MFVNMYFMCSRASWPIAFETKLSIYVVVLRHSDRPGFECYRIYPKVLGQLNISILVLKFEQVHLYYLLIKTAGLMANSTMITRRVLIWVHTARPGIVCPNTCTRIKTVFIVSKSSVYIPLGKNQCQSGFY